MIEETTNYFYKVALKKYIKLSVAKQKGLIISFNSSLPIRSKRCLPVMDCLC